MQKLDPSLKDLLDMVCDTEVISNLCHCYFLLLYTVIEELSDQNYIVATPGHTAGKQLCHVNLIKRYFFCAEDGGS